MRYFSFRLEYLVLIQIIGVKTRGGRTERKEDKQPQ